jgi:5-carboxymethyl-2-hydroxymuconate isomerase
MPHLTLEYSANLDPPAEFAPLFLRLHGLLARTGGIRRENCKSRAYACRDFLVGEGRPSDAFVHLDIRFLEGRSDEVKQAIGAAALDMLVDAFSDAAARGVLQATVEVRDIARASYFKFPPGTLTPL